MIHPLADHAEKKYQSFSEKDKQRVQRLFIQLVLAREGTQDTRKLATRQEVGEDNWTLVTKLADARLVVTNKTNQNEETVEIIHEALIREWATLQNWIATNREFLNWQEQLKVRVREWESAQKENELLLRGASLVKAREWLQNKTGELSLSEQNFINQSLEFEANREFRTWQEQLKIKIKEWESDNKSLLQGLSLAKAEEWLQKKADKLSLSEQNFIKQSLEFEVKKKKEQKRRRMLINLGLGITSLFSISVIGYYFCPSTKLSIVIVKSEDAPYEAIITDSFLNRLRRTNKLEVTAPPAVHGGFNHPRSEKGREPWKKVTDDLLARYSGQKVDYFVTTGTFATTAIMDAKLVEKLQATGLISLGITDPFQGGLVKSPDNWQLNNCRLVNVPVKRQDNSNIAVVRYGMGGLVYGKEIGSLFPSTQKLVFVYDKNTPQDTYVAKNIEQLKKCGDDRFIIRSFNRPVKESDLRNPNPKGAHEVYFAWYGLDNLIELVGNGGASILNKKENWVIPSTYTLENKKNTGIVVSTIDEKVGKLGAEILLKNFYDPTKKLGNETVVQPPFHIWLDCKTIKDKGMKLSPAVSKPTPTREDTCP